MEQPNSIPPITEQKVIQSSPSHLFILFLIILLVAVLSGVGTYYYLASTQPLSSQKASDISSLSNPTTKNYETTKQDITSKEGWKTYTNNTYQFSMQYPTTLKTSSNDDSGVDFVSATASEQHMSMWDLKVRLFVLNPTEKDFAAIYAAANNTVIAKEQHAQDAIFTKTANQAIAGKNAVSYTYTVPGNQTEKTYTYGFLINTGTKLINISTTGPTKEEADELKQQLDTMVSTLSFTDKLSTCDVQDPQLCSFIQTLQEKIAKKDFAAIMQSQQIDEISCKKPITYPYFEHLCSTIPNNGSLHGYNIGHNQSEISFVLAKEYEKYFTDYFSQRGPYLYQGTVADQTKAAIVYLNAKHDSLYTLMLMQEKGKWNIKYPIIGYASNDFINLTKDVLKYIH